MTEAPQSRPGTSLRCAPGSPPAQPRRPHMERPRPLAYARVRVRSTRGRHGQTGLTLSELLTTLVVAALLAGAAVPAMSALTTRAKADAALEQLSRAIRFTRYQAITHRTNATLCPGRETECGRRDSWHEGAMVFLDANANGVRDAGEAVLQRLPPLEGLRVRWRSFRNRKSLSMRPDGTTDWQPGNMVVCPVDGDAKLARQLIVNAQGRVRFSRDEDGDGIVEDARGRPVSC
ncbi:MAG: GspH/FimT family protein [Gammaproteobacteria bacterium]|nr:GspH/FimT family protein [Gammaproteobacteria bacterium]